MKNKTLPTTRWRLSASREDMQRLLVRELGVHPILSQILSRRDIENVGEATKFLSPSLNDLHNPFTMQDMDRGVERVLTAMQRNETIAVYGDYDADGITSVAVLVSFLRSIHPNTRYHIPDRLDEGYSLNIPAIDRLKTDGVSLLITVDCGVSDEVEIAHANGLGMDVVVLDHHEVPETLPRAVAVINPHRTDCTFPFKSLAAVGIAFNFVIALRGALRSQGFWQSRPYPNLKDYLDLVALGTIGDICPLVDENRIFARFGLDLITEGKRTGIQALKEIAGVDGQNIDSTRASFALIPRINAAGRVGSPGEAVELLLEDNPERARDLARRLDGHNRRRQAMEKAILQDILSDIKRMSEAEKLGPLVFASDRWHPGVIGIVAARLVDLFARPAILISLKDGIGKGSGRSVTDFNIYQGLKQCDSLLLSYGGHQYAAGISIREEDIAPFAQMLDAVLRTEMKEGDFVSHTQIDAECGLGDIDHALLSEIGRLEPFGSRNPEPVVCVRNVNVCAPTVVGNNHLRMRISADGVSCNSIWFSKGHFVDVLPGLSLDIAFTPQINRWNGAAGIQLKMRDMAYPAVA